MKKYVINIIGFLKSIISLFVLYVLSLLNCKGDDKSMDEIYRTYLENVENKIYNINSDNLFVYFTDTHISDNVGNTSYLINDVLNNTSFKSVVWGGDAIPAYGKDIEILWKEQVREFDKIKQNGNLYCLRGNHDFTIKSSSSTGCTFSQKETAQLIFEQCDKTIVRNKDEDTGCYYYFDDIEHRIRYIVWDTNDSDAYEDKAWGLFNQVSYKQLSWVANEAILSTPQSFSIIMLSHIGIVPATNPNCVDFIVVKSLLEAVQSKSNWSFDGLSCDFSKLNKDVHVLMWLSGHTHQDLQTYTNGVWHVTTASDAFYPDYQKALLTPPMARREKESATEHVVDCVSLDIRENRLVFNRIGVGVNRVFHLSPIRLSKNSSLHLFESNICSGYWGSYDVDSVVYGAQGWSSTSSVVSLSKDGLIKTRNVGSSIVYYLNKDGYLNFYNIIVEE